MKNKSFLFFLIPYIYCLLHGAFYLFFTEKGSAFWLINDYHNPFFDLLFKYGTMLGEGILGFIILIALALFVSYRKTIIAAIVYLLIAVFSYVLKHHIFKGELRPTAYFVDRLAEINVVEGVKVHALNSFPSGHTMAAFGFYTLLALLIPNKYIAALCFFMAIIVGTSRIYLAQHFLVDVYVGSIISVFTAMFIYFLFNKMNWLNTEKFNNKLLHF